MTRVSLVPFSLSEPISFGRITLRAMSESDVEAIHGWMSDPEVVRYLLYEPRARAEVLDKVREYSAALRLEKDGDYLQPVIVVQGEVVGLMYFKIVSTTDLTAEIGWTIALQHQRNGYAFDAARAVLRLGFEVLGLRRVFAELDPRNQASAALCRRLGMRHEAHFVEAMLVKQEWTDSSIYAILHREWLALQ